MKTAHHLATSAPPRSKRVIFVSWTPHHRANELAEALEGRVYVPHPHRKAWPAPVRYAIQGTRTLAYLARTRPTDVLFTNPPFVAGAVLLLAATPLRFSVWADSHSGAFNDPRWMRFSRLNDWIMRRCAGVIVTNEPLARRVRASGSRPLIVNYPSTHPKQRSATGSYLVATLGFQFDEPVDALLKAAGLSPEVRLIMTGAAPADLAKRAPPNCVVTGWLSRADYERTLAEARGVICLTTREDTMQTGAYEALQYGLPMVLSGTGALREFFSDGVIFVDDHESETLARAVTQLWRDHEQLSIDALRARSDLLARCEDEISALRAALGISARATPD